MPSTRITPTPPSPPSASSTTGNPASRSTKSATAGARAGYDGRRMSARPVLLVRSPYVSLPEERLEAWCARFGVEKLVVFGSAKHGPFRPDSDVDLLFWAPRDAPVYQADGRASRGASDELRTICGVHVDLVCARSLVATTNPFVIHNAFVEPRFGREDGMLWYLRAAASGLERVPDVAHALADPRRRMSVLLPLLRFARAAYRPELVERWIELGLGDVPWPRIREILEPTLGSHRALGPVMWAPDDVLVALVEALRPHLPRVRATAHRQIAEREPRIDARLIAEVNGEWPPARFPVTRTGRFARCTGESPSAPRVTASNARAVVTRARPSPACAPGLARRRA